MALKAFLRAVQSSSRLRNDFPRSWCPTAGHTCSTGLRSGEFAGHMPPLNSLTPWRFRNFFTRSALCTEHPSCWKRYPVDLRVIRGRKLYLGVHTPGIWSDKPKCSPQNCSIGPSIDSWWAALQFQPPFPIDCHPNHNTHLVLGCRCRIFCKKSLAFQAPASHKVPRAYSE